MTTTILIALLGGLVGGVISPLVVAWLHHKLIWQTEKLMEIKYSILTDTVRALSQYATDALDSSLQDQHADEHGHYLNPDTKQLLQNCRNMSEAFFSPATHKAVLSVMGEKLTRANAPNMDFERKRAHAIERMACEIGILKKSLGRGTSKGISK